jgi:hypothetical protein
MEEILQKPQTRILLAEDDDSLRAFLTRALERAGYAVRACADGDEAITALDDGPYDLLLTDIVMPGADGIEVAREAAAPPWLWPPAAAPPKGPRCCPSPCICARSWRKSNGWSRPEPGLNSARIGPEPTLA